MAVISEAELEMSGDCDVFRRIGVVGFKNSAVDSVDMGAILGTRSKKKRMQIVEKGSGNEGEEEIVDDAGAGAGRDLMEALGPDVMIKILSCLDARSVALSLLVSHGWHGMASSDRLWSPMCKDLWIGKAHIPRLSILPGLSKLEIYSHAMLDGRRVRIRREDLCDHAWDFHFTKGAPEYWRDLDPFWKKTGPPMRRYFHPDGSLSADPDDLVWGGHACCYTVVTSIFHDGTIREHYVRINRWPQLCVSRRKDWGWDMSNLLCAYSSIPDAYKQGGTGPLLE